MNRGAIGAERTAAASGGVRGVASTIHSVFIPPITSGAE